MVRDWGLVLPVRMSWLVRWDVYYCRIVPVKPMPILRVWIREVDGDHEARVVFVVEEDDAINYLERGCSSTEAWSERQLIVLK